MQLTLFTDYSLRTLMYLYAHKDKRSTIKDISETFGISRNHMVKVVHNLVRRGYIESLKGKNGGIWLAKNVENIGLRELFLQLEPNFNLVECFDRENKTCKILPICALKNMLHEALEAFLKTFDKYTLADTLIQSPVDLARTKLSA